MSVQDGASANVVGNWFIGPKDGAMVWSGSYAYFGGGDTDQNTGPTSAARHLAQELSVPARAPVFDETAALAAGAAPRDAIDACYVALPVHTFSAFRASRCAP